MKKFLLLAVLLLASCDNYSEIKEAQERLEQQHKDIYELADRLASMSHEDNDNDSVPSREVYDLASEIMDIVEYDTVETILDDVLSDLVKSM